MLCNEGILRDTDIYPLIVKHCNSAGIKYEDLAVGNILSLDELNRIKEGKSPTLSTLQIICDRLRITLCDLFNNHFDTEKITPQQKKMLMLTRNFSNRQYDMLETNIDIIILSQKKGL